MLLQELWTSSEVKSWTNKSSKIKFEDGIFSYHFVTKIPFNITLLSIVLNISQVKWIAKGKPGILLNIPIINIYKNKLTSEPIVCKIFPFPLRLLTRKFWEISRLLTFWFHVSATIMVIKLNISDIYYSILWLFCIF